MKQISSSNDLMRCQLPARTQLAGNAFPFSCRESRNIEITCSKETLGLSNHFLTKNIRKNESEKIHPPLPFFHQPHLNFIPSVCTHRKAEDKLGDASEQGCIH
jgi:hypothetical protein